jgi:transforming growth factor-beta-induced protein
LEYSHVHHIAFRVVARKSSSRLLTFSLSSPAVFAPTDAAFEALPAGALEYLLDNVDALSYVLGYHVVPGGVVLSNALTDGLTATTLIGENITFSIMEGVIKVEGAVIETADVMASNGVIHVIDSVLIPPAPFALPLNIVQLGMADPKFSTLVAAVTAAGLADALSSETLTVLAPTNEAFAALPDGVLDYLLDNTDILAEVLLYHVSAGATLSSDISNGTEIPTLLDGESLTVGIGETNLTIGGANFVEYDHMALNGVVHVINKVLLPPSLVLPPSIATIVSGDDFVTLKSALEVTGLFSPFANSPDRYTIFAPSESAFDAFKLASPGTFEALLAEPNMTTLQGILLYHAVSPEVVTSADIVAGLEFVETLQGENVSFTAPMGEMMSTFVNDAKITTADVMALNGIVHVIDSLLIPSSVSVLPGIFQVANATGQFNTLLAAVKAAGLVDALNMPGPFSKYTMLTRHVKDDEKKSAVLTIDCFFCLQLSLLPPMMRLPRLKVLNQSWRTPLLSSDF